MGDPEMRADPPDGDSGRYPGFVMPGLVPGIHDFLSAPKTWMAGTSPAMTIFEPGGQPVRRR
jgi:hypothetical protein